MFARAMNSTRAMYPAPPTSLCPAFPRAWQNSHNRSKTARNLHSALEIAEKTHDNKLKAAAAKELHTALTKAELRTPATESEENFQ